MNNIKNFTNNKKADSGILELVGLLIVILVILVIGWLLGSYRVDQGQGGILTTSGGAKVPIQDYGWKWRMPFLTDFEKWSLVNNNIYFPADYLILEQKFQGDSQAGAIGYDIKTTDDKVIDVGALMS